MQIHSIKETKDILQKKFMQIPPLPVTPPSGSKEEKTETGICVLIPACNNAHSIGSLILSAAPFALKIIVADDCSQDSTVDISLCAGVQVIRHQKKIGFEETVLSGIRSGYSQSFPAIVVLNGNAQFRAEDIPRLCDPILHGTADLVIGSRYLSEYNDLPVQQKVKQYYLQSSGANTSIAVTDSHSGFFALSRKAAGTLDALAHTGDLSSDLLLHVMSLGLPIKEIPVSENADIPLKGDWIRSVPVLVAIPAYNEERTIAKVVAKARNYCDAVLVVNDGSDDSTATIARNMHAIVISHDKNLGYGAALKTIFSTANTLHTQALVIMDADGQHDPCDIENILAPILTGADVVIGSRVLETGNEIPLLRKTGMKVLDAATNFAGKLAVTDSQSGFRGYSQKAIKAIRITEPDMGAGSEILVQASDQGLSIVEIPVGVQYGQQKKTSRNMWSHGIRVLESIIWQITQQRPLLLISLPGLILCIIGLYFGTILLQLYNQNGYFSLPLSVLVAIFLILGALGMFMGVTFHVIARILPRLDA